MGVRSISGAQPEMQPIGTTKGLDGLAAKITSAVSKASGTAPEVVASPQSSVIQGTIRTKDLAAMSGARPQSDVETSSEVLAAAEKGLGIEHSTTAEVAQGVTHQIGLTTDLAEQVVSWSSELSDEELDEAYKNMATVRLSIPIKGDE
ncbi:MAG TPA: hypothetical protein VN457_02100 [Chlamydiales bacterium]|nr:hypothetical protein [Chlamydiales bacterium]